jgi:dTDP-4-amino-4,6-dideoxygalactose transaminase
MIPVTKPFFPPIDEYITQIKRVYAYEWITNRGELVLELEEKLKRYLEVDNILITNNGTVPLQIAMKLLGKCGEIITTPFSYVATTSAIIWENCTPVFVDIDPVYLTIDETKIEEAITPKSTCILATHVFGNPCNVEAIEQIAKKHNLSVIYDAAHCFGVKYNGHSIFNYGDISTCSFHGTKLFHTGEGGAVFCQDEELRHKIYYSHNFGHNGPLDFHGLGINGKISELQAAMGISVFNHIDTILHERKRVYQTYIEHLHASKLNILTIRPNTEWNYSYFPVIFEDEQLLLEAEKQLKIKDIFARRYFYPSLNTINYTKSHQMPVSESISSRILCLPMFADLSETIIVEICKTLNGI